MIASITGTLREREGETLLIETAGGVGYAVTVPLGTLERIPAAGQPVSLLTELVVREDSWALYGFDRPADRAVFQRLLSASGVGPKLALAVLSALGAERTVRSIQQRDLATLASVPGIGRKKAEKLAVELADRLVAMPSDGPPLPAGPADEAVPALVRLGYPPATAEEAVRGALAEGVTGTGAVIRAALQSLAGKR
ncbi:MAG: Holliday junction branch migration protein RuvA [Gemmatimonadetes bacterium]|nr:Holliday junction branch migration protein RuvA [Gemmatimonadota bacterium]